MVSRGMEQRIEICRRRYEAAPESRAFAPLADALRQAGRHEEALPLLEEGLVRHPRFAAALVILGHTLLDAGRSSHARRVLQTVLERDKDNVVALRLLTEDARSRQAWPEAVSLLGRLVVLEPDDERWPAALTEARANRNMSQPTEAPETSFATLTLVEIYLAQGYRAKAMTALRQMQQREPEREDIQAKIAEIGLVAESPTETTAGGAVGAETKPGEPISYQARRAAMAAKRAEEKKSFEDWISRIRSDEEATR